MYRLISCLFYVFKWKKEAILESIFWKNILKLSVSHPSAT